MSPEYSGIVGLIFRTLRYRNYRLFFAGQCISLIGNWVQQIALGWLVYRLTDSVLFLGIVAFAVQFPTFLFSPLAGVFSDRWNRRRTLVLTQGLSMLQALSLAVLVLTGTIAVWHIILLSLSLGCVNAIDIPTRQSFVIHMIEEKKDLSNAIALNSAIFTGATFVGPALAGLLITLFGEGICFLLNGVSYIAVIAALLSMNVSRIAPERKNTNIFQELKEGLNYAFDFKPIRFILLLLALTSFMGVPYTVLMPAFARDILHSGPHTLGFLMSASGAGALIGAIYLAARKSILGLGRIIPLASGIFGAGLIGFSLYPVFWLSLLLMTIIGFGAVVQVASSNTLLQTIVEDNKRGRVMSLFAVSFMGMAPLGSLMAGTLAGIIGITTSIMFGGICCIMGAIFFARKLSLLRSIIRPIYADNGIVNLN
ncbi:MAG TPA: MFS transporter [Syntrophus sp. (in: bacteria)]|nr:MFS transporter [Syntrophus sp. (in: bacteria)]